MVIVGAGFAGTVAARALKRCDADVVLIDRRNHHIFQPLLYQVATAVLAPSEIAGLIRQLAKKQKNVGVMLAEVTGLILTLGRSTRTSLESAVVRSNSTTWWSLRECGRAVSAMTALDEVSQLYADALVRDQA
jgi:flavin-dependent dehydrogenase